MISHSMEQKMFVNGALCENGVIAETFQESNAFICLFEMN